MSPLVGLHSGSTAFHLEFPGFLIVVGFGTMISDDGTVGVVLFSYVAVFLKINHAYVTWDLVKMDILIQ